MRGFCGVGRARGELGRVYRRGTEIIYPSSVWFCKLARGSPNRVTYYDAPCIKMVLLHQAKAV
jgi:hypothetical protein